MGGAVPISLKCLEHAILKLDVVFSMLTDHWILSAVCDRSISALAKVVSVPFHLLTCVYISLDVTLIAQVAGLWAWRLFCRAPLAVTRRYRY